MFERYRDLGMSTANKNSKQIQDPQLPRQHLQRPHCLHGQADKAAQDAGAQKGQNEQEELKS